MNNPHEQQQNALIHRIIENVVSFIHILYTYKRTYFSYKIVRAI
jgi:hypothetical protein